jgi:hypothetical protein
MLAVNGSQKNLGKVFEKLWGVFTFGVMAPNSLGNGMRIPNPDSAFLKKVNSLFRGGGVFGELA